MKAHNYDPRIARHQRLIAGGLLAGVAVTGAGVRYAVDKVERNNHLTSIANDPSQLRPDQVSVVKADLQPGEGFSAIASKLAPSGSEHYAYVIKALKRQASETNQDGVVQNGELFIVANELIDNPDMIQPGPEAVEI